MLCADCKRTIAKYKTTGVSSTTLCLPCKQAKYRKLQLAAGKRPTAKETWEQHLKELEDKKYTKAVDAVESWLKH